MKYKRYRFTTKYKDYRPEIDMKSINCPWWCTGCDSKNHAIIVCYLPVGEPLEKYWDDAFDISVEDADEIFYSTRFPKPSWLD